MTAREECERQRLLAVAWSLKGTKWVHMGRSEHGVDCAGFALLSFVNSALIPPDALGVAGFYPQDFMFHNDDERFLRMVEKWMKRVDRKEGLPADITLHRVGKVISHIAIVTDWPNVLHAWRDAERVEGDDVTMGRLKLTYQGIWTLKEWT